jgi:hypothetical protein
MGTLVIGALLLCALYGLACAIWPYAACGRCEGAGKIRSPGGKAWRACPRCHRTGERLRWGRRLFGSPRRGPAALSPQLPLQRHDRRERRAHENC